MIIKHCALRIVAIALFTLTATLLTTSPALADPYPPNFPGPAVHDSPDPWPAEPADPKQCGASCGDWIPYARAGDFINDPRTQDPSNGGTAPQNYVNIASSCIDKSYPSIYYYYDATNQMINFRWRVEQQANTYGTGPTAGAYAATDPWNSGLWTVFFDLNSDGFRDLAAHLDGSSGAPGKPIDILAGVYSRSATNQSLDYINDPNIFQLAHNPTGFTDATTNRILNFQTNQQPIASWPNGAAETVWNYGSSRSKLITKT